MIDNVTQQLDEVMRDMAFIRGQCDAHISKSGKNRADMQQMFFECSAENNNIVNVTFRISAMLIKNLVHCFLDMRWAADVSHWADIEELLAAMGRVGHGPLRFGLDPLGGVVSWYYNAKRNRNGNSKALWRSGKRERDF
jgi:hypothetical protein